MNGDPVNLVDPLGLIITPEGTPTEIKLINNALDTLSKNSSNASLLIQSLKANPLNIIIRVTNRTNTYTSSTNTCTFNPNNNYLYDNSEVWHKRPPEIGLAHELIHAYHDIAGIEAKTLTKEENNTVGLSGNSPFTENLIRKDYGLPMRLKY